MLLPPVGLEPGTSCPASQWLLLQAQACTGFDGHQDRFILPIPGRPGGLAASTLGRTRLCGNTAGIGPGMAWNLELQHLLWQVSNPRLPRARLSVETKNLENVFPRVRTHTVRVQSRRLAHFAKLADDNMDARLILATLRLTLQRETCIVSSQQQAGPTLAA